jgi:HEAT repeat protein
MPRSLLVPALVLLLAAAAALKAEQDDPIVQRRRLSEWLKVLQEDPETNHRRAALLVVQLLGPRYGRQVVPAVATALRGDREERVRAGAATVLGHLAARARKDKLDDFRYDNIRDALVTALRGDKAARVRQAGATALGRLDEDARGAVPVLASALKDKDRETRIAAADTLRGLGPYASEALPELQQVLGNAGVDQHTRALCALAIGRIGVPDGLPALSTLQEVLSNARGPKELRKAAAETLGLFGKDSAGAAAALGRVVTSGESDVMLRRAAVVALDAIGPQGRAALPALQKALRDEDRYVRCHAMHALGGYGRELGDDTRAVVGGLLRGMDDNVLDVRLAAIETLGVLGTGGAGDLGEDAKAVIDRLTEATRDAQKPVREAAAAALKRLQGMP